MNGAELKTNIERLGVGAVWFGDVAGRAQANLYRYMHTDRTLDIPAHVAEVMWDLLAKREEAQVMLAARAAQLGYFPRYTSDGDFAAAYPQLDGWPRSAQGALIAATAAPSDSIRWV